MLIVIEGLDGSGKSTQIELLNNRLSADGINVKQIKLPDYDDKSSTLVKMYLKGEFGSEPSAVNAYATSLFYAVDRFASFSRHWKKEYESGMTIISDRYTTSNAVHQMVKLDRSEWDYYLEWLTDLEYKKVGIPEPSLVIFLDMPIEISQRLMTARYNGNEVKKDIHERDLSYLYACRETALYTASKCRWKIIECSDGKNPYTPEEISNKIYELTIEELRKHFNA